jgi:polysaccharide export outer membrane protein
MSRLPVALRLAAIAAALSLSGCVVPRAGPSAKDFTHASQAQSINLVEATMQDAAATHDGPSVPTGFDPAWRAAPPSTGGVIGVGDVLSVTFFERDGLNLFSTATDGNARLDGLKVDPTGVIQVPYAGNVRVAGLTPAEARTAIIHSLSRLTFGTDVTVTVTEQHSRLVSVQGDVAKPGVVPISPETDRLLAVLGTAAPTPADMELATVTVRRGSESGTMRLSRLYDQPQDDIALQPGDVVIVRGIVGTVNVLGAAGLQGRVKITRPRYSLMDALGDARGLDNSAADPAAVYVMRQADMATTGALPRVYHFDMRNPVEIAVANDFMLHNGDAVLISNASFAQYQKVLSTFSGIVNSSRAVTTIP